VDVQGNRYSVPDRLAGSRVMVRITLDGVLSVLEGDTVVITHRLQPRSQGWVTVPEHHAGLWREVLRVEQRPLAVYEEVGQWS
jgi:hypothetical protein